MRFVPRLSRLANSGEQAYDLATARGNMPLPGHFLRILCRNPLVTLECRVHRCLASTGRWMARFNRGPAEEGGSFDDQRQADDQRTNRCRDLKPDWDEQEGR